jgi:rare lipoprotein A
MRSSVWTIVIVSASMMSCVCIDLGFGEAKSNNRDFKSISGIASVYDRSSGKQTASGEQLDENALTAAHRSLPFGTVVRVKNNKNGREALVRINDRGPFVRGRIIDLTPAGAKVLGFSGTADVSLMVADASSN